MVMGAMERKNKEKKNKKKWERAIKRVGWLRKVKKKKETESRGGPRESPTVDRAGGGRVFLVRVEGGRGAKGCLLCTTYKM